MCTRACLVVALALMASGVSAQPDSVTSKSTWFVSLHSGILFSKPGTPAFMTAHAIQGVRYDRLHAGVGLGYDAYEGWQTVPVFAGIGYDITRRSRGAAYVQAHVGYARAWNTFPRETSNTIIDDGGYFVHPILGYRADIGKLNLHLSVGYKLQRLHYEQRPFWWSWDAAATRSTVIRDMQRLSVQIGLGLN